MTRVIGLLDQVVDQVAANEAGGAGDKYFHGMVKRLKIGKDPLPRLRPRPLPEGEVTCVLNLQRVLRILGRGCLAVREPKHSCEFHGKKLDSVACSATSAFSCSGVLDRLFLGQFQVVVDHQFG